METSKKLVVNLSDNDKEIIQKYRSEIIKIINNPEIDDSNVFSILSEQLFDINFQNLLVVEKYIIHVRESLHISNSKSDPVVNSAKIRDHKL